MSEIENKNIDKICTSINRLTHAVLWVASAISISKYDDNDLHQFYLRKRKEGAFWLGHDSLEPIRESAIEEVAKDMSSAVVDFVQDADLACLNKEEKK